MQLFASNEVKRKLLLKHGVTYIEAEEAFNNFSGFTLEDTRAVNKSKPSTVWCLSETFNERLLKLVFVPFVAEQIAILRTAYEPDDVEIKLWSENQ